MQRIPTLLKKITELAERGDANSAIDIDLMLDYTRVVYADLLEWRGRKTFVSSIDSNFTAPKTETAPAQQKQKEEEPSPEAVPVAEKKASVSVAEIEADKEPAIASAIYQAPAKPTADIRQSIGINDKYLFMSELFGNSRDDYEQALDKINTFSSYAEAGRWVNDNLSTTDNGDENDTMELFHTILITFFKN